jgi:hypothetical protein
MAEEEREQSGGKSTDLAEGELDTVEESIRAHECKCCSLAKGKPAEPDRRNMDLAEGERDTVEESIRIHEKKHDAQGRA